MCSEDDRTKKKKDDKSDKNNQHCDMITTFYCAFIVLEAVLTALIAANVKTIGDNSLVLAFIGILATFVVISNYVQILEIKKSCDRKIEKFKTAWDIDYNELKSALEKERQEMQKLIKSQNTENIVDVKKIKYQVEKENDPEKVSDLLKQLLVYEHLSDYDLRSEILAVLDAAMHIGAGHENVLFNIQYVIESITPNNEKDNPIIADAYMFIYELMDQTLIFKNLNTFAISTIIFKRIVHLGGNIKEAKQDLQQLQTKFKNPLYKKAINSTIEHLNNNSRDIPDFDKDVYDEIEKCKNDE